MTATAKRKIATKATRHMFAFANDEMSLLCGVELFLTEEIEVGVAAGPHVDDGRKVPGKSVRATNAIP